MTKNLTFGKPALLIVAFTVPLLIGNLFQQFYNVADTFIVGRTLGVSALAAVGSTGSLSFLILWFVMTVTQGAAIITSQRFGANDMDGIKRSVAATIWLTLAVTLVMMLASITLCRPILELLGTPREIIDDGYRYIIIIFWGMPAAALFNAASNLMRSMGDSRTPLYFLVLACAINIALDYLFILTFHAGVAGAAYATVVAQFVSGVLCLPVIKKRLPMLVVTKHDMRVSRAELWAHIRVALPMGFMSSIIAVGTVVVTYALNKLGAVAIAAFVTGQKIDQIATMPLASIGVAATTFSAQNFGARKYGRIKQGIFHACLISVSWALLMGAVYWLWGSVFARLFLKADEAAVTMTHLYLKITGAGYSLLAVLFIFRGSLQGLGNSLTPTLAGVGELIARIFSAIVLGALFGYTGICFSGPLAFAGALIPLTITMALTLKRFDRRVG